MVAAPPKQLDQVFGALADPTRRAILARLADGEATVNELVALSISANRPSPII
jgi:DNA-binding transcriptional ArsR family regulator